MARFTGLLDIPEPDRNPRAARQGAKNAPGRVVDSRPAPAARRGRPGRRRVLLWVSDITVTAALILGLFTFWEVSWSNVQADRRQSSAADALSARWANQGADAGAPAPVGAELDGVDAGTAFGMLHVPRFGQGWSQAVIEGTTVAALNTGPGHYTASQGPGARGNMALAGHRDGQGAPFHDADKLATCDPIVVETKDRWYTYRVLPVLDAGQDSTEQYMAAAGECMDWSVAGKLSDELYTGLPGRHITTPTDVDVVAPVPRNPQIPPTQATLGILTLTTCHPVWSNAERLIIHAVLTETDVKAGQEPDFMPAALAG